MTNRTVIDPSQLTSKQRRHLLLNLLMNDGCIVFRKEVAGHIVAIVMPGETEVRDTNEPAVWENLIDVIDEAKQSAIKMNTGRS